jgi:hypothetical protein
MGEKQQKERLNWLSATIAAQRNNISDLLARLRGVAFRFSDSLSLHTKFMKLMDQVAVEREKELDIIYEIETVEKRHLELKKRKLLRHANPETEEKRLRRLNKKDGKNEKDEEDSPQRLSLAEILAIFWLFSSGNGFFSRFNFFQKNGPLSGEPMPQPKAEKHDPTVE